MRTIRRDGETGASAAEVALLIAVVAIVAAGALSFLGSRGDASLDKAGKGIHEGAAPSGGTPGGGGSGGPTPTVPPTTTTPPTPTTAAPTTTTTHPPTTTTAPPTTTTTRAPSPATAGLSGGRGVRNGSSRWDASADLVIAAPGSTGSMAGTATVQVRTQRSNGTWTTTTIEVPVGADGRASIETGPYARTGSSRINTVEYTVIGVDLDDGRHWDGVQPTASITRPA